MPGQSFLDGRGRLIIPRRNLPTTRTADLAKDLYHTLRTTTWTRLIAFLAVGWIAINLVFAAVLYFGDAEILNARAGSFLDRFWFSVQTLATIGYGYFVPVDPLAHVVVTIESFVGIIMIAMATGLFFAKFSTPIAKVMFSKVAVIADEDGAPTLMIRMANARATAIVEATAHVVYSRDELNAAGARHRRLYDLTLRRTTSPVFALSWTIFHVIDAHSPLHGATAESLARENANLFVTFTGIDDSLAASVHSRYVYLADQIHFGEVFADIIHRDADGNRYLDYSYFDQTRPAPAPGAPTAPISP
jgi:inward rectifier potassium channel